MKCVSNYFGLALACCLVNVVSVQEIDAQEDQKSMVAECINIQRTKFRPLQQETSALYGRFASRSGAFYEVIRWLEDNPATAEQKRQLEIARLEAKLEAMKEIKSMTTGEALKDVKATIEAAHGRLEDVKDEQRVAMRPLERKRSALRREFGPQGKSVEPTMEALFLESGGNESTSDLKRSYSSFSMETGTTHGHYKRGDKNSAVCMLQITLVHDDVAKDELGKFDQKYPIVDKSDTRLEILVGDALVTIYSNDKAFKKENLGKALTGLVDLDKLIALLPE